MRALAGTCTPKIQWLLRACAQSCMPRPLGQYATYSLSQCSLQHAFSSLLSSSLTLLIRCWYSMLLRSAEQFVILINPSPKACWHATVPAQGLISLDSVGSGTRLCRPSSSHLDLQTGNSVGQPPVTMTLHHESVDARNLHTLQLCAHALRETIHGGAHLLCACPGVEPQAACSHARACPSA